jgi:prepilin-type N-terminal cleavage/methylation domain-containing protein
MNIINKKAFTLIELLVVVLIIGILAAIALPQYQKAVEKSKIAQAVVLLRSLRDAQQRYLLIDGNYTINLLDLDIEIPGDFVDNATHSWNYTLIKDLHFQLENGDNNRVASAYTQEDRNAFNLSIKLDGRFICSSNKEKYKRLCQTLGKATPITTVQEPKHSLCKQGECWYIEF